MGIRHFKIRTTKREQIIDIGKEVLSIIEDIIKDEGISEGLAIVYVPHATAAIIINENYDENVKKDIINYLSKSIPKGKWLHDIVDGNGDAHIKASIIGPSEVIIIKDGRPILGTWQSFGLAEFDGPRNRIVYVCVFGSHNKS